jgi:hypothetical protein
MSNTFRSNDLADLPLSSQQNRDAALLRATTELFLQEESHDRDEIRRYEELATHFLPRVGQADRAYIAERLATRTDAPSTVIRLLARDTVDIARHVLPSSPVLTSLDLLTVIAATGAEHHRLIAKRPNLGADVERALRLMGDVEAAASAGRADTAATAAIAPAPQKGENSTSPVPIRQPREPIGIDPSRLDVWHFLGLERPQRLRLMAELATRPPPRRYAGPASRLDQAFRSILGAAQVVGFARRGERRELVSAIAEGLGLEVEIVVACIEDKSGEPFAVLLKVLGLDNVQAQQVLLLATPAIGKDVLAYFRLTDIYAAMESSVAEILVSAWRGDAAMRGSRHAPIFADNGNRRGIPGASETVRDKPSQPATNRREGNSA